MGSIPAGEFKKGIKVQIENEPYEMLECNFVKPGKGQALYHTKLRNLLRGTLFQKTYRSGDSLETADVHRNDGVYSYRDGDNYVFMDNSTYDQLTVSPTVLGDAGKHARSAFGVAQIPMGACVEIELIAEIAD